MQGRGLPSLSPGALIAGKYIVVARLGSGGMGDVYEVEHTLLGRRFALKRLHAEKAHDRRAVERFMREAKAAANTGHPGIVDVVDLGFAEEGWPYLVMEKLVGQNLRERVRRSKLPEIIVLHIAKSLLEALDAVHRRGIVHRDIKPENVFLVPMGDEPVRVKILDFGLVQLQGMDGPDMSLTQSGTILGTPLYMSPEQARGDDVDHRTDIYALGALLYECVAGKPPFSGHSYASVIAQVIERKPPLEPLGPCSGALRAIILKALEKDRERRYASAAQMREAVVALMHDAPKGALSVDLGPLPDPAPTPRSLTPQTRPRPAPTEFRRRTPPTVIPNGGPRPGRTMVAPMLGWNEPGSAPSMPDLLPSMPSDQPADQEEPGGDTHELKLTAAIQAALDASANAALPARPEPTSSLDMADIVQDVAPGSTGGAYGPDFWPMGQQADSASGQATRSGLRGAEPALQAPGPGLSMSAVAGERSVSPAELPPRGRTTLRLAGIIGGSVVLAGVLAGILIRAPWSRPTPAGEAVAAGAAAEQPRSALVHDPAEVLAEIDRLAMRGMLEEAAKKAYHAGLRAPDDVNLVGRDLILALMEDRARAYRNAHELDGRELHADIRALVDVVLAFERGAPLDALPGLDAAIARQPKNLLLRYLRGQLLSHGGRFREAQAEYMAILEGSPGFAPAVEELIQRFLFGEKVDEATRMIERHIAHTPDTDKLHLLELELQIGKREYSEALARIEDLRRRNPGREDEFYQFEGDLKVLLGQTIGALTAYKNVGKGAKYEQYACGALLHDGRNAEARTRFLAAIEGYPKDEKRSRLGKLGVDASLFALEVDDADLAARVARALETQGRERNVPRYRSSLAFARAVADVLADKPFDAGAFPMGEESPLVVLLRARALPGPKALPLLRKATAADAIQFDVVPTHVYPPLFTEHARAAFEAGEMDEALFQIERVLLPRHYDSSRGVVYRRAMKLYAKVLRSLGRDAEAAAAEEELRNRGRQR